MLEAVEKAGIFAGYLEDLCYTPKNFLKPWKLLKWWIRKKSFGQSLERLTQVPTVIGFGIKKKPVEDVF